MITELRQAIAEKLNEIENIGVVHHYERYARETKIFGDFYIWQPPTLDVTEENPKPKKPPEELRGGFIRWVSTENEVKGNATYHRYNWELQYFLALSEKAETQVKFDDVLERILGALTSTVLMQTIQGFSTDKGVMTLKGQPQMFYNQHAMFAGNLVHHGKIKFTTELRVMGV